MWGQVFSQAETGDGRQRQPVAVYKRGSTCTVSNWRQAKTRTRNMEMERCQGRPHIEDTRNIEQQQQIGDCSSAMGSHFVHFFS
jgi:hypothetical protein